MAIYSLHHSSIGKTTQKASYTTGAHVRYITRSKAVSHVDGERLPREPKETVAFFDKAEDASRKNARLCDKLMLALPRELNTAQRHALVRQFAETITEGRASWFAAFHDLGKDEANPHCHLIIRDRDAETGKRVFGMSEKGSTERLRVLWEDAANEALARAKSKARIDRRTLKAQGIQRRPTIHEGVRARRNAQAGRPFSSRKVRYRNGVGARTRQREVDYRNFDAGSRTAYNETLKRRPRSKAKLWHELDEAERRQEIEELRRLHKGLFGKYRDRASDNDIDFDR